MRWAGDGRLCIGGGPGTQLSKPAVLPNEAAVHRNRGRVGTGWSPARLLAGVISQPLEQQPSSKESRTRPGLTSSQKAGQPGRRSLSSLRAEVPLWPAGGGLF